MPERGLDVTREAVRAGPDEHELTLVASWKERGGVLALAFVADPPLRYEAGQHAKVRLPNVPQDPREGVRTLSIASGPSEERVLFATVPDHARGTTPFKAGLTRLRPGDRVVCGAPKGPFTVEMEDTRATHVLVALGIGVTAVRAIASEAAASWPHLRFRVFQTPIDGGWPFDRDLREAARAHPAMTYEQVEVADDAPPSEAFLADLDVARDRFYVAGPPLGVATLHRWFRAKGVSRDRFKGEPFAGY